MSCEKLSITSTIYIVQYCTPRGLQTTNYADFLRNQKASSVSQVSLGYELQNIISVLVMQGRKICEYCRRINRMDAEYCFFCGRSLYSQAVERPQTYGKPQAPSYYPYYVDPATALIAAGAMVGAGTSAAHFALDEYRARKIKRCPFCQSTDLPRYLPDRDLYYCGRCNRWVKC